MSRRYFVYVVELAPREGAARSRRSDVYVGSSAFPPRCRLKMHHVRRTGSRHVRRRGRRLLPGLYAGIGPFVTRSEAEKAEKALARRLKRYGYRVFGACDPAEESACWS